MESIKCQGRLQTEPAEKYVLYGKRWYVGLVCKPYSQVRMVFRLDLQERGETKK